MCMYLTFYTNVLKQPKLYFQLYLKKSYRLVSFYGAVELFPLFFKTEFAVQYSFFYLDTMNLIKGCGALFYKMKIHAE